MSTSIMANLSKGRDAKLWVYVLHGYDRQAAESLNATAWMQVPSKLIATETFSGNLTKAGQSLSRLDLFTKEDCHEKVFYCTCDFSAAPVYIF